MDEMEWLLEMVGSFKRLEKFCEKQMRIMQMNTELGSEQEKRKALS